MTTNPLDPLGVAEFWTRGTRRAQTLTQRAREQAEEAQRQAALTAAKLDVDAAYVAFRSSSDRPAAENLAKAVATFLDLS